MSAAAELLAITAALAASIGVIARLSIRPRVHAAGVPILMLGWIGLVVAIAPDSLRERPLLVLGALVCASVAGWLVAGRLVGRETWLLAVGAAVLTLRVPVPTGGGENAMLLGPLYAVIAIGALVLMRRELPITAGGRQMPVLDRGGTGRMLDIGTAAVPIVAALSLPWSFDRLDSTEALAFFLIPFPLAYAIVRAWLAAGASLRPAAWAVVATGAAFAVIGLVQAATRQVWWNPKVIDSNRFRPDFRTNSLFWDPNIYGRALVVSLLVIVAWALLTRASRGRIAVVGLLAAMLVVALWNTYSQSSWFALAAALVLVAVLTLPPHPRRWVAGTLAVVVAIALPFAADGLTGADAQGRAEVIRAGLALAGERPVLGWGAGSFEDAALARATKRGDDQPGLLASHTTPITVLAELGIVGIAAYLALLGGAAAAVLARWRRTSSPAAAARAADPDVNDPGWPHASIVWAGAAIAALLAHSLLYAGFFEDATLWVALAVLAGLPADATTTRTNNNAVAAERSAPPLRGAQVRSANPLRSSWPR